MVKQMVVNIVSSPIFWTVVIPASATIVAWFLNEHSKLRWEQHKRKEENYKQLLECLKGFTAEQADIGLRNNFLQQVTLAWMYASDNVIHNAYHFLESTHEDVQLSQEEKKHRAGAFVHAVRRDLLSHKPVQRTKLRAEDYKLLYTKSKNSEQSHGEATSKAAPEGADFEVSHT